MNQKLLKDKIERLPEKPGIYFFKDRQNNVIYIGKARSLRDRVKSYFQSSSDVKVNNILSETADVEFILTDSAREAAFLENNFIRQYQPKFNLLLKDDKSFPYLKLTLDERFPGIYLTRRVEEDGARYFGPFSPAHQARTTIHLINKYFGIRGCEEAVPGKRKRPCLEYDLKLCSAPCVEYISEQDYRENVDNALLFLEGKTNRLLKILKRKMKEAAKGQEFEQAAHWRDFIWTIEQIKEKPKLISVSLDDRDIFGFRRGKEKAVIFIFQMRKGKVIESEGLSIQEDRCIADAEILSDYLLRFYRDRKDLPKEILLPFVPSARDKIQDKLSDLSKEKIKIIVPRKGKNRKLVELADKNAEILMRKSTEEVSPLREAKDILGLKTTPKRIEGFDVSNIGGEESVASLVVFENGRPHKQDYRKYKIKTVEGPDDVASLQEVIRRRYTRVLREKKALPDLILVDGGKGQFNAAKKSLKDLKLGKISVISLAKKEEIIFTPFHKQGLNLERTSPALKLFQNVRDEAHRFAVSFHRVRREKKSFSSPLDEIPGLGKKRKARLLAHYKSIDEIQKAPLEELARLIGEKTARELKARLKSRR